MLYIATFLFGALVGHVMSGVIDFLDGLEGQHGACTQDCNQGRDCTCGQKGDANV